MSPSLPNRRRDAGFSLLEVTFAIVILTVGLLSGALLTESMLRAGRNSKYMSEASLLASEKLEDLNRWDGANSPYVCVPSAQGTEGALNVDIMNTTICDSGTQDTVSYYDDVFIAYKASGTDCPSATAGCLAETVSYMSNGSTTYATTYHSADGTVQIPQGSTTPPTGSTYHRRWLIELNPVINGTPTLGVRRVTVWVKLMDDSVQPQVIFQMSMVRP